MKIELVSDFPNTDEACREATGKSKAEWFAVLREHPELADKRRESLNFLHEPMNKHLWWPTTIWVEYQNSKSIVLKDGKPDGYNICSTKTVSAPVSKVFGAFKDGSFADSFGNQATEVRVREDKDIRYRWKTAGVADESEIEVMFAEKAGKTGITLNHNRIQSREEADGLRRAWGEALSRLKSQIEGN